MILKLLLIIAVITIVYFMFFKKNSISNKNSSYTRKENKTMQNDDNDMVACATCNLYVEIHEAILSNGKYYCSRECAQKA